jgi:hypothetical protein
MTECRTIGFVLVPQQIARCGVPRKGLGVGGRPDSSPIPNTTFEQLWKINVGTGFSAPPMSFEVDGKQYVAILSGASGPARAKLGKTPEVREMRNQAMLFVFGL